MGASSVERWVLDYVYPSYLPGPGLCAMVALARSRATLGGHGAVAEILFLSPIG